MSKTKRLRVVLGLRSNSFSQKTLLVCPFHRRVVLDAAMIANTRRKSVSVKTKKIFPLRPEADCLNLKAETTPLQTLKPVALIAAENKRLD